MDVFDANGPASTEPPRQRPAATMRRSDAFFDKFRRSIGNRSLDALVAHVDEYIRLLRSDVTPSRPNSRTAYGFATSIASAVYAFDAKRRDVVESSALRGVRCSGPTYSAYVRAVAELIAIYADVRLRSEQTGDEYADGVAHAVILMVQKYLEGERHRAVDVLLRIGGLNRHVASVCEPVFEYVLGNVQETTSPSPVDFARLVLAYRRRKALYETIEEKARVTERGAAALRAAGGAPAGFAAHPLCKNVLKVSIPARATDVPRYLLATGFNTMAAVTEFFAWLETHPDSEDSLDGFRSLSLNEKPARRRMSRIRPTRPSEPIVIDLTDDAVDEGARNGRRRREPTDAARRARVRHGAASPNKTAAEPTCIDLTDDPQPPDAVVERRRPDGRSDDAAERKTAYAPVVPVVDRKDFLAKIIGLAERAKNERALAAPVPTAETTEDGRRAPPDDPTPIETTPIETTPIETTPIETPADEAADAPSSSVSSETIDEHPTEIADGPADAAPVVVRTDPSESGTVDRYSVAKCVDHFESPDSGIEASPTYENESGAELLPSAIESSIKDDEKPATRPDVGEFYEDAIAADARIRYDDVGVARPETSEEASRIEAGSTARDVVYESDAPMKETSHGVDGGPETPARADDAVFREDDSGAVERAYEIETVSGHVESAPDVEMHEPSRTDTGDGTVVVIDDDEKKVVEGSIHVASIESLQENGSGATKRSGAVCRSDERDLAVATAAVLEDDASDRATRAKASGSIAEFVERFSGSLRDFDGADGQSAVAVYDGDVDRSPETDLSEKISAVHISAVPDRIRVLSPVGLRMLAAGYTDSKYPEADVVRPSSHAYGSGHRCYVDRFDATYGLPERPPSCFDATLSDVKNHHRHLVTLASRKIFEPPSTTVVSSADVRDDVVAFASRDSPRSSRTDPETEGDRRTAIGETKRSFDPKTIQTDQDSFENFFKGKYVPNERTSAVSNGDSDAIAPPSRSKIGADDDATAPKTYVAGTSARRERVRKTSKRADGDAGKFVVPILKIRKEVVALSAAPPDDEPNKKRKPEKSRVGFGMWETNYCRVVGTDSVGENGAATGVDERRKRADVILKNKTGKEFAVATNGSFATKRQTGILIKRDYGKLPPGRASTDDDARNAKIAIRRPGFEETFAATTTQTQTQQRTPCSEDFRTGTVVGRSTSRNPKTPTSDPRPDPRPKRAGPYDGDAEKRVPSTAKRKSESGGRRATRASDAAAALVTSTAAVAGPKRKKTGTAADVAAAESGAPPAGRRPRRRAREAVPFPVPKNSIAAPPSADPPDLYPEFSNSPKLFPSDDDGASKKRMLDEALDSLSDIPPYDPSPEIPKQARVVSEVGGDVKPTLPWPVEIKADDGSSDAWPDRTDDNAFLPFKKRKLTSEEERIRNRIKTERWKMSDVNVSYPSTPMISIAELALEHYDANRRTFKTPAQLKALPPLPPAYLPRFTAVVSDVLGSNLNINNHTYNYPTINYHVNGVPFFNFDYDGSYGVRPVVVSTVSCDGTCGSSACRGACPVRAENHDERRLS